MANRSRQATGKSASSALPPVGALSVLRWCGLLQPSTLALLALLGLVLLTGLAVVETTHQNRFAFNQLQELRDQANQLQIERGQLLIEQSTFGVEGRIEEKAEHSLGLRIPDLSEIVMVKHE